MQKEKIKSLSFEFFNRPLLDHQNDGDTSAVTKELIGLRFYCFFEATEKNNGWRDDYGTLRCTKDTH